MKKLFILLTVVILAAMSSNVFAQSTGTTPAPGATHTYSVTLNGSNTYAWAVTEGDLTTSADTDAVLSSTTGNSINITWASTVVVGDWYYIHVVETDANSCTNEKVLPVQITASPFYLAITNTIAGTACYTNPVSITLSSNAPEYSHGTVTLDYTITPTGANTSSGGYSFDFANSFSKTGYTVATPTVTSGNGSVAGTTVTVTDHLAVTVRFVVTNGNTYTNATDAAGDAADFTSTVTISGGETGNGISDNTGGTYVAGKDVARPNTTTITTN